MSIKAAATKVGLRINVQITKIGETAVNVGGCVIDGEENKKELITLFILEVQYLLTTSSLKE